MSSSFENANITLPGAIVITPEDLQNEDLQNKNTAIYNNSNRIWNCYGQYFEHGHKSKQFENLPIGIYIVHSTPKGFVLEFINEKYEFDYKIYGLETQLIKRIKKTFDNTKGNLGMIFNGKKGTGKTVTAKQVCNNLKMPVILLTQKFDGINNFINSINQNLIVFVDEYEKIYEKESDLLTIMDGALSSGYRRVFILTTNTIYVNENLIDRPSRIRYFVTFKDLMPNVILEVVEDLLIHKDLKKQVIRFISSLESITIDIAKSIIQEVNIHKEDPEEFTHLFNAKKLNEYYDIEIFNEKETEYFKKYIMLFKNVKTDFHLYDNFDKEYFLNQNGFNLYISGVGRIILKDTLDKEIFNAEINLQDYYDNDNSFYQSLEDKFVLSGLIPKQNIKSKKRPTVEFKLKISKSYTYNKNFKDSGYKIDW